MLSDCPAVLVMSAGRQTDRSEPKGQGLKTLTSTSPQENDEAFWMDIQVARLLSYINH